MRPSRLRRVGEARLGCLRPPKPNLGEVRREGDRCPEGCGDPRRNTDRAAATRRAAACPEAGRGRRAGAAKKPPGVNGLLGFP